MLSEVITIAAVLLARIGIQTSGVSAPASPLVELLLFGCLAFAVYSLATRISRLRAETLARGGWWGFDAYLLALLTPLALASAPTLAVAPLTARDTLSASKVCGPLSAIV